jgi:PKD repeat protein
MRPRFSAPIAIAAAAALPACSCDGGAGTSDAGMAGDGGAVGDAAPRSDAAAPLIWIDFAITGCAASGGDDRPDAGPGGDAGAGDEADGGAGAAQPCTGPAPLSLAFVPVAPAPVEVYEWSFGDGSEPDRRAAPEHVYTEPGVYDVSLFGEGPGGTASVMKTGLVVVGPAGLGNACSADEQCASGRCVCGAEPCDGVAAGFCSADCSAAECDQGVCADLAAGAPPDPAAWQARLCLPGCGGEAACPTGLVCRELLRADGQGWTEACFAPGLLADIGDSCTGAGGEREDWRCASGLCMAEGLRGVCSALCADEPCPASAACATFTGGEPAPSCVARCEQTACDGDPWLACEAPGGAGPKGFSVDEEPSESGYCAPRSCDEPEDCPLGQCLDGSCGP